MKRCQNLSQSLRQVSNRWLRMVEKAKGRKEEVVTMEYTINLAPQTPPWLKKAIKEIRKFSQKAIGTNDVRVGVKLNKHVSRVRESEVFQGRVFALAKTPPALLSQRQQGLQPNCHESHSGFDMHDKSSKLFDKW
ncbi:hypothetical protein JHK85_010681 [Glycine max]|nr:hypothetical protein JHK85_010681 [Glycine max]